MPVQPGNDARNVLTEAQLGCLRAARTKLTNKNIAIELGISPNTVAQHLKEARLRLGDVTRAEAVEIIYAFDHQHPHNSTSASGGIVSGGDIAMVGSSPVSAGVSDPAVSNVVREERAQFRTSRDSIEPSLTRLVRHWLGSFNCDARADQRGKMILLTALTLGVITLIIIAVGESLNRTLRGLGY
jgi:DNA-binding CsgD family transcriptional regulator